MATMLLVALIFKTQFDHRQHLPIGPFESEVQAYLESNGEPDALLLSHPLQVLLQAQTSHPAFVDMATAYHASYRPSLGPSVQAMYEAAYGIRFDQPPGETTWRTVWEERSPDEWGNLQEPYKIDYVIAPTDVALALELAVEADGQALYRLPQ